MEMIFWFIAAALLGVLALYFVWHAVVRPIHVRAIRIAIINLGGTPEEIRLVQIPVLKGIFMNSGACYEVRYRDRSGQTLNKVCIVGVFTKVLWKA